LVLIYTYSIEKVSEKYKQFVKPLNVAQIIPIQNSKLGKPNRIEVWEYVSVTFFWQIGITYLLLVSIIFLS